MKKTHVCRSSHRIHSYTSCCDHATIRLKKPLKPPSSFFLCRVLLSVSLLLGRGLGCSSLLRGARGRSDSVRRLTGLSFSAIEMRRLFGRSFSMIETRLLVRRRSVEDVDDATTTAAASSRIGDGGRSGSAVNAGSGICSAASAGGCASLLAVAREMPPSRPPDISSCSFAARAARRRSFWARYLASSSVDLSWRCR
jgi:hypothetical protein